MKNEMPRFEFLPAKTSKNSIEIHSPFSKIACKHFANRDLDISCLESGAIRISFEKMDMDSKRVLLEDVRVFLKKSRQEVIDNLLIYKSNSISYL